MDSVRWVRRKGVKLDNPYWVDKLVEVCEDYQPDLIIFDPLQRIHSKVEDRPGKWAKCGTACTSLSCVSLTQRYWLYTTSPNHK